MAQSFFKIWLKFFQQDNSMSREEKQLSWVILLIGTVLWPLVVPIAYLSLLEKKFKSQAETLGEDESIESAYSLQKRMYTNKFVSLESLDSAFNTLEWHN
jgi:flagellar basal body-associated protein FliL